MSDRRRLDVAVGVLVVLSVLGCGKASVPSSEEAKRVATATASGTATSESVATRSGASASLPSNPRRPVGDATAVGSEGSSAKGTFQPRLTLPTEEDPALRCAPRIAGMSGLGNGDVWIAGLCGLRARITPSEVIDARATPQPRRSDGPGKPTCLSTPWYDGVLARSATEVYVHGFSSCGTDPNAVWAHPVEHFDGAAWTTRAAQPFELRPDLLVAGEQGPVYGATLGCTACEETPFCNVVELGAKGLRKLRECRVPRPGKAGTAERFLSAVVDATGVLWVSGYRDGWPNGGHPQHFFLRYENAAWSEHPFEDAGTFELDGDGELWLFGASAVWRRQEGQWNRFEPLAQYMPRADGAEAARPAANRSWLTLAQSSAAAPESIAVRSGRDMWWFGTGRDVFHFDGHDVHTVAVADLAPNDLYFPFSELTLAGPQVYLRSSSRVWQLIAPSETAPVEVTAR